MPKSPDWFSAVVYAAVIYIVAMAIAKALMGGPFDALTVSGSIFLLLILPVLYRFAGRPKERPVHVHFAPKTKP